VIIVECSPSLNKWSINFNRKYSPSHTLRNWRFPFGYELEYFKTLMGPKNATSSNGILAFDWRRAYDAIIAGYYNLFFDSFTLQPDTDFKPV
jgi:hypothetical protein